MFLYLINIPSSIFLDVVPVVEERINNTDQHLSEEKPLEEINTQRHDIHEPQEVPLRSSRREKRSTRIFMWFVCKSQI